MIPFQLVKQLGISWKIDSAFLEVDSWYNNQSKRTKWCCQAYYRLNNKKVSFAPQALHINRNTHLFFWRLQPGSEITKQLFCNPCIALRFDRCIKSMINQVEPQMGMQNLTNCFMVNVSIKQYIETVSLTIASWLLDLFGPNVVQKPWNYHRHFVALLRKRGKKLHLWKCSRCR